MALIIDLRIGEAVKIDDGRITVRVMEKTGQRVKLRVEAEDMKIDPPPKEAEAVGAAKMLAGAI